MMRKTNPGLPLNRPFVMVNMAMSADGKSASRGRKIKSFGSPQDQSSLYKIRSRADAIVCGATTMLETDALLDTGPERFVNARLKTGLKPHPIRIIASGRCNIDPSLSIFKGRQSPLLLLTSHAADVRKIKTLSNLFDAVLVSGNDRLNWEEIMPRLCEEWGIRTLLCEGGGRLNSTLFESGLVDRIHLTVCPYLAGGKDAPTISDGLGFNDLKAAPRFRCVSLKKTIHEVFLVYDSIHLKSEKRHEP